MVAEMIENVQYFNYKSQTNHLLEANRLLVHLNQGLIFNRILKCSGQLLRVFIVKKMHKLKLSCGILEQYETYVENFCQIF